MIRGDAFDQRAALCAAAPNGQNREVFKENQALAHTGYAQPAIKLVVILGLKQTVADAAVRLTQQADDRQPQAASGH
ncbi:hypothetical protein [Polaromonas naphthalenivorans]|uniref:Uncharacterized protein n=1 Tax=Polaromonas naphthalenivorans (strain CJ2) TaxID=365044 RepID=A1VSD5_POLNA|nr:hypothetical protein [Polaromonas naphthalenivorans]ABM38563.1 hypothetical protein Pnap_3265 [Polaromonas naphthalenivorans CJ2]